MTPSLRLPVVAGLLAPGLPGATSGPPNSDETITPGLSGRVNDLNTLATAPIVVGPIMLP